MKGLGEIVPSKHALDCSTVNGPALRSEEAGLGEGKLNVGGGVGEIVVHLRAPPCYYFWVFHFLPPTVAVQDSPYYLGHAHFHDSARFLPIPINTSRVEKSNRGREAPSFVRFHFANVCTFMCE